VHQYSMPPQKDFRLQFNEFLKTTKIVYFGMNQNVSLHYLNKRLKLYDKHKNQKDQSLRNAKGL
jgi:hypothetical protein